MAMPFKDDPGRTDEKYVRRCLELARRAAAAGEVPVGAVVVFGDRVLGEGWNRTRERQSALAHAEMLALEAAFAATAASGASGASGAAAASGAFSSAGPAPHAAGDPAAPAGRLSGAVLYCSLEPCFMCAGAALHARVGRVVFAAADPKFGACGSLANLPEDPRLNHRCPVNPGVLAEASAALLRDFFQGLR